MSTDIFRTTSESLTALFYNTSSGKDPACKKDCLLLNDAADLTEIQTGGEARE